MPKSYIGQEQIVKKHRRSKSSTEIPNDINNSEKTTDNNSHRCKSERNIKRVTFNKKIHIIYIHNYKNENKILYYGNKKNKKEEENKKENKCISCIVY